MCLTGGGFGMLPGGREFARNPEESEGCCETNGGGVGGGIDIDRSVE